MPAKLIFFGTEDFSLPFLEALLAEGYGVQAVVTKPDTPRGRSSKPVKPAVKRLAEKHSITVVQPKKLHGAKTRQVLAGADAAVLSAYGLILPDEVLALFAKGIFNVHPSDLPKHRGPSPIEQTILDGDKKTAVSLMKLVSKMDTGPVYAKRYLDVPEDATKKTLEDSLAQTGVKLLREKLPGILSGKIIPKAQDESQATYTKLIQKKDGQIDWSQPAWKIERQIRAYRGWPGSFTTLNDVRVTIHDASVLAAEGYEGEQFVAPDRKLGIYCGEGALEIKTIQPAGKKPMSSEDFLRGYARF